jgi:hypothetical protein
MNPESLAHRIADVEDDLREALTWLRTTKYQNAAICINAALNRLNSGNPNYTPYQVDKP